MMKILYLDCFSGISGDMFLGAMVDAGVSVEALRDSLKKLGVEGLRVEASKVLRGGIAGTKVDVIAEETSEERHLSDIIDIIESSGLSPGVRKTARAIFRRLAAAESKVHGIGMDEVHFHEVGAIDAIADVVGAAICLELSGVGSVYSSPVNVGEGFVKTAHGLLPVPAPATLELLKGVPIYSTGIKLELVTPTGAAILSEISKGFGPVPHMTVETTGYGAGSKEIETPNLLRVMLGEMTKVKRNGH